MKSLKYLIPFTIAVLLILFGGQKWLHQRDITSVVHTFFTAMREGKTASVLNLMEPALRQQAENRIAANGEQTEIFEPGLEYQIHHCTVNKKKAEVEVWIQKDGFFIKPTVHLQMSANKQWKIAEITNLTNDPLWDKTQKLRSQQHDQQLSGHLLHELGEQPSVKGEE